MSEKKTEDFIKKFNELEKIVEAFESGKLELDKGIEKFEEGLVLAKDCKKALEKLENKINVVKESFNN